MTNLLILSILTAVYQIGFSALFEEHMIFERIGKALQGHDKPNHRKRGLLPMWINKPLWYCPSCMSSIHGTAIYLLLGSYILGLPWEFFLAFAVLVVGIVTLIYRAFPGKKRKKKKRKSLVPNTEREVNLTYQPRTKLGAIDALLHRPESKEMDLKEVVKGIDSICEKHESKGHGADDMNNSGPVDPTTGLCGKADARKGEGE